jgi:hypothetical protein
MILVSQVLDTLKGLRKHDISISGITVDTWIGLRKHDISISGIRFLE